MESWLEEEYPKQIELLENLVNQPSGSLDSENLEALALYLKELFIVFTDNIQEHRNSHGKLIAISFSKQVKAQPSLFLNIHFDTVFDKNSPFKRFERLSKEYASGPGVIDAKGGVVILWTLLKAFNKLKSFKSLGYTVVLNCDEELGSPDSTVLLQHKAKGHTLALVFEPSLENKNMIIARPATAFVEILSTGRTAHAGRTYFEGKNAIKSLLGFINSLNINSIESDDFIVNLGVLEGGERANIVPDYAKAHLNLRAFDADKLDSVLLEWQTISADTDDVTLNILTRRCAKPNTITNQAVFNSLADTIKALNFDIKFENSLGVCDGNSIASVGIPVVDTFGPEGTGMHTHSESIYLPSLKNKSHLCLKFILNYLASLE